MINNFDINLNDGVILNVEPFPEGKIHLTYLDWREKEKEILFIDAIYLELLYAGMYSSQSGDFIVENSNEKILDMCRKIDEPTDCYKLFKIMDSWDENKLVEIIAKEVQVIT